MSYGVKAALFLAVILAGLSGLLANLGLIRDSARFDALEKRVTALESRK